MALVILLYGFGIAVGLVLLWIILRFAVDFRNIILKDYDRKEKVEKHDKKHINEKRD